jgi:hypothetical protein
MLIAAFSQHLTTASMYLEAREVCVAGQLWEMGSTLTHTNLACDMLTIRQMNSASCWVDEIKASKE